MIEIDGSVGGGQILRSSLSLSAITSKSIRIINIRKKRPSPGIQPQHKCAIDLLAKICNASLKGNKIGSDFMEFEPSKISGGIYEFNIGTAGSIALILQVILPVSLFSPTPSEFTIIGGTDTQWSPSSLYFSQVFCENIKRFGINTKTNILNYGFYPKGGGKVNFIVNKEEKNNKQNNHSKLQEKSNYITSTKNESKIILPNYFSQNQKLKTVNFTDRGKINGIEIFSIASKGLSKRKVAERQAEEFLKHIPDWLNVIEKHIFYVDSLSEGSSILSILKCENSYLGALSIGKKGKSAEEVGAECVQNFKYEINSNSALDKYMADQILIYIALAGKGNLKTSEITEHTITNISIIEKFLPVKFFIENNYIYCKSI